MARTFDPIREMDRLLSDVTRTPATVAVPMDLYREGDDYTVAVDLSLIHISEPTRPY